LKPKNFRFESLLKYKAFIEEAIRHELADVSEKMEAEEKRLSTLEGIWRQAVGELKERQMKHVPSHEILMYHTYLQQLSLEIGKQRERVIEIQRVYHEKRESLIGAAQERKIVEKVREKDKQQVNEEANRAEKKVMDETAKNRYVRENC